MGANKSGPPRYKDFSHGSCSWCRSGIITICIPFGEIKDEAPALGDLGSFNPYYGVNSASYSGKSPTA